MSRAGSDIAPRKGPLIQIETGAGIVKTSHYEHAALPPDVSMEHVVLPKTAATAPLGDLNRVAKLRFMWPEPSEWGG